MVERGERSASGRWSGEVSQREVEWRGQPAGRWSGEVSQRGGAVERRCSGEVSQRGGGVERSASGRWSGEVSQRGGGVAETTPCAMGPNESVLILPGVPAEGGAGPGCRESFTNGGPLQAFCFFCRQFRWCVSAGSLSVSRRLCNSGSAAADGIPLILSTSVRSVAPPHLSLLTAVTGISALFLAQLIQLQLKLYQFY